MVTVVASCDKDQDLFYPYYKCMEKYWPNHPEIVYLTETVVNPYYKTICKNYPLEQWTRRIRESLSEIGDDKILFTTDDDFLNDFVNITKLEFLLSLLIGDIANINLEKSFTDTDVWCNAPGVKYRPKGSYVRLSLACGLWQKDKLIKVLENDSDPWAVEKNQDDKDFEYLIVSNSKVLSWMFDGPNECGALYKGKWHRGVQTYFAIEGIDLDLTVRGFCD